MEWSTYADVWALAVTFYELLTGNSLFEDEPTFDVALDHSCPSAFPKEVFAAIRSIIGGNGQETAPDQYVQLFELANAPTVTKQLPDALAAKYNLSSKRQKTLVLALLNLPRLDQPRAKKPVVRDYYQSRGLPLPGTELDKFIPVYSQLKSKNVVRYTKPKKGKVILTDEFIADFEEFRESK